MQRCANARGGNKQWWPGTCQRQAASRQAKQQTAAPAAALLRLASASMPLRAPRCEGAAFAPSREGVDAAQQHCAGSGQLCLVAAAGAPSQISATGRHSRNAGANTSSAGANANQAPHAPRLRLLAIMCMPSSGAASGPPAPIASGASITTCTTAPAARPKLSLRRCGGDGRRAWRWCECVRTHCCAAAASKPSRSKQASRQVKRC